MMENPKCALCLQPSKLQSSHIIPNAFFRKILQQSSGKAISFSLDEQAPVKYSSDSWHEPLLCFSCEQQLSNSYESYAIARLTRPDGNLVFESAGIKLLELETTIVKSFFISILWRAAISKQSVFSDISLPSYLEEKIRLSLYSRQNISDQDVKVVVSRLTDETGEGGFSREVLRGIITAPFVRAPNKYNISFCFLFGGFFIEFHVLSKTNPLQITSGTIDIENTHLSIPFLDIFEIPEVVQVMRVGRAKYLEGKSQI